MQTKLSDFIARCSHSQTLPFVDVNDEDVVTKKRCREASYTNSYPLSSSTSHSVRVNLQLLNSRAYSRLFIRSLFAASAPPQSAFARGTSPTVRQVSSSCHLSRTNEDGESLISSADIFKNCVTDIVWDPKDEFFIASRRSRFQLFGASSFLKSEEVTDSTVAPLLDFKVATAQARLGAENRISFGLATAQFLGGTLSAICGYNGVSRIDVYDLEDLDEEVGDPLRSFDLSSAFPNDEQGAGNGLPTATAITSVSDVLAIAALSNGSCMFADSRNPKPLICTRAVDQMDILSTCAPYSNRTGRRKCNTAVSFLDCGCNMEIITGTKSGLVELWDLRKCDQPVAKSFVCGSVEAIIPFSPECSNRCGAPLVWLNTDCGNLVCLSVGASSFEEVNRIEARDICRSHSSASLPPPKMSMMQQSGLLVYPLISSNRVLLYDVSEKVWNWEENEIRRIKLDPAQRDNLNIHKGSASSEFKDARSLLSENGVRIEETVPSVLGYDVKKGDPTLLQSLAFHDWSNQISCVSAAKQSSAIAVGGDDGDIHLLLDLSA
jgi:hypothetical protein